MIVCFKSYQSLECFFSHQAVNDKRLVFSSLCQIMKNDHVGNIEKPCITAFTKIVYERLGEFRSITYEYKFAFCSIRAKYFHQDAE